MVRGVFEDVYNYMMNGILIRRVINKLNEIDFNRKAVEFYTPHAVTQFVVDKVDPKLGASLATCSQKC